jgi:hypothetical protein
MKRIKFQNHEATMNHYWLSWRQPTEDCRPLQHPPNGRILGWWQSGSWESGVCEGGSLDGASCECGAILCALVGAGNEGAAKEAVLAEWPEADGRWRFCDQKPIDWLPGDRFPLTDWMQDRQETQKPRSQ